VLRTSDAGAEAKLCLTLDREGAGGVVAGKRFVARMT